MGLNPRLANLTKPKPKGKWNALFTIQEQFLRGLKVSDLQEFEAGLFSFTLEENQRKNRDLGEAPRTGKKFLHKIVNLITLLSIFATLFTKFKFDWAIMEIFESESDAGVLLRKICSVPGSGAGVLC